jgi:hypothetical protein
MEPTVYQITKLARTPEERDLIIAMTSKQSMQKLIAKLSEQYLGDKYRVTAFQHKNLPGLER